MHSENHHGNALLRIQHLSMHSWGDTQEYLVTYGNLSHTYRFDQLIRVEGRIPKMYTIPNI
jgi:hypothetical protein